MKQLETKFDWDGRTSNAVGIRLQSLHFQLLFERSADAIWLFDPQAGVFMDCNGLVGLQ